jgi:antitoxin CptB
VPAGDAGDDRLKRLRLRSWRRGTREMDLILGGFADARLAGLDAAAIATYEALLAEDDLELYRWVAGNDSIPAPYSEIIASIRRYHRLS